MKFIIYCFFSISIALIIYKTLIYFVMRFFPLYLHLFFISKRVIII